MKKIIRLSQSQIMAHLLTQQESGLTIASYCSNHSIKPGTFYNWKSKHKIIDKGVSSTESFVPVKISERIKEQNALIAKLELSNGFEVSFYSGCSADFLSEILKQL